MYWFVVSMTLTGCSGLPVLFSIMQRSADAIDDIVDCEPTLECLYWWGCDLNRIGKPDGRRSQRKVRPRRNQAY